MPTISDHIRLVSYLLTYVDKECYVLVAETRAHAALSEAGRYLLENKCKSGQKLVTFIETVRFSYALQNIHANMSATIGS